VDHGEEAFGELVVSGCDGAVDFQTTEEALDLVAFLVERPIIFDLRPAIWPSRNDGFDVPVGKIGPDGIGIVSLVGQECLRRSIWQGDQRVIGLAIRRFADCQVEGEWPSPSISQTVKLTGEPAPRAAKSSSTSPPFPPAAETWARTVVLSML
jgi:hypothetical protein